MTAAHDIEAALTSLARQESGRILALLARYFADLDLADEAVQDALTEAAATWPGTDVPDNPAGWLLTVARNKGIDRLRRAASARRRTLQIAPELTRAADHSDREEEGADLIFDDNPIGDEHLRLVLLCCHPALDQDTQVALTLRLVGGLSTAEIASAFLLPPATLAQRIVRAKRKIRDARIPLSIPPNLNERIDALLGVLYLIFNEGYLTRGDREGLVRVDLMAESLRLTRLAGELVPGNAEIEGLIALELFGLARVDSRLDPTGELILLHEQDRSRWDRSMIEQANILLSGALHRMRPGPFQVQALIAAQHANARVAADTDWLAVVALYQQLSQMTTSPVVALNHAVAVAMADGPNAGLAMLERIDGLAGYHLYHAARGELLLRAKDRVGAHKAFARARELANNPSEQRHLDRRLAACEGENPSADSEPDR